MFEEVVLPCRGDFLEKQLMPALRSALFRKELEPLGEAVRALSVPDAALKAAIDKDYQELRTHILHGQIDYKGEGPLPEHWKQYIDKETNYFDWRHPRWTMDAEKLLIDAAVRAVRVEGWDPRVAHGKRSPEGLVTLLLEVQEKSSAAAPLIEKFLEGMPEWLQHNNAYTGGYLTEGEVVALLEVLTREGPALATGLKGAPLLPAWVEKLERAKRAGVGLTWTVV